jgi:S-adenosylmethionine:tRNA-ribosyltransferase-isomerase (queuine synthetase)
MKRSDFYYDLPQELIAQTPVEPRDSSRLLAMNKNTGKISTLIRNSLRSMINHNVFLYFDLISHSSLLFGWRC